MMTNYFKTTIKKCPVCKKVDIPEKDGMCFECAMKSAGLIKEVRK